MGYRAQPPRKEKLDAFIEWVKDTTLRANGFYRSEAERRFGRGAAFGCLIYWARRTLRPEKQNIVCRPTGRRNEPWLYQWTEDEVATDGWTNDELTEMEEKLDTVCSIIDSKVERADPSSQQGRNARTFQRDARRVLEDIVALRSTV